MLGALPVMLEIDGVSQGIKFRVVDAVDQPMILEMDFGRAFKISTRPALWQSMRGRWNEFVTENGKRAEVTIEGECAGLSSISDEQRSEVDKLVDEAMVSQKDQPGYTRLIEHHFRVTEKRPFEHKMRWISKAVLGEARRTVEKWSEDGLIEPSASDYSSAGPRGKIRRNVSNVH